MLLALALILTVPPAEEPPIPPVPLDRVELVDAFRAIFASFDSDHDGRISRAEWGDVTGRTADINPKVDRAIPIRMALNAPPEEVFGDWDKNADGLVSFEEFARESLANFDCEDADHDGTVQPAEDEAGRTRCSVNDRPENSATPVPAQ